MTAFEGAHVAILAGGGTLPREIADRVAARGGSVHIVAIDGEADGDFASYPTSRVNWGQVGGILRALREFRADKLLIVGHVRRPNLRRVRPDAGFFLNLPALLKILGSGGDDGVLRRVVRFFERRGIEVIGPADAAPELVIGEGPLGVHAPTGDDRSDIETGLDLVRALGQHDIGQSVVVDAGRIVAIEGAEGTDRMLERVGNGAGSRGVLVKRTKPTQDLRVDMPAIGPETVARVAGAGLRGIAVEANRVLVAGRAETTRRCDDAKVYVTGIADRAEVAPSTGVGYVPPRRRIRVPRVAIEIVSRRKPRRSQHDDIARGAAVIVALTDRECGAAVVVALRYVLAVEAGEGAQATVERSAALRQWGRSGRNRDGVVVLRNSGDADTGLIRAAAAAGLAGIAVMHPAAGDVRGAAREAEALGLFLVSVRRPGEAPQ